MKRRSVLHFVLAHFAWPAVLLALASLVYILEIALNGGADHLGVEAWLAAHGALTLDDAALLLGALAIFLVLAATSVPKVYGGRED